jgi:molybdopterin synthase sulfur carrier subunit
MPTVQLTRHLYSFFPALEGKALTVEATTVAEVVGALDALAPGLAFYICDERGRLRRHVNIFVDQEMIADRGRLSDRVGPNSHVMIMQALSGG